MCIRDRLRGVDFGSEEEEPIELRQIEMFAGYREDTLADLAAAMQVRHYAAGETIYAAGSPGDELYWVRRGSVRQATVVGDKACASWPASAVATTSARWPSWTCLLYTSRCV